MMKVFKYLICCVNVLKTNKMHIIIVVIIIIISIIILTFRCV